MDCADRAVGQEYSDDRCLELREAVPIIGARADGKFFLCFIFVRCIVQGGLAERCEESLISCDIE